MDGFGNAFFVASSSETEAGSSTNSDYIRHSSKYHSALYDGEFLLRCAMTHDWEDCIHFCAFLEEIFTMSVIDRKRHWQHKRIQAAKRQLTAQDQWGNTALHAACFYNPPVRVITAMLTAASAATPRPLPIACTLSRDHSTPLLVACATGASLEVIRALVSTTSTTTTTTSSNLVTIADQMGGTPLSELAVHYELQRKSPMHQAAAPLPLDQVQLVRDNTTTTGSSKLLDVLGQKVECLLQAAWANHHHNNNNSQRGPYISTVHGAAHVAASCPPILTRLILRGYPHMISFANRKGVLPLHLCCQYQPKQQQQYYALSQTQSQSSLQVITTQNVSRHAYFVQQLLHWYPAAAKQEVPSSNGRLPFVQAIAAGQWWHVPSSSNNNNNNTTAGPLQWLWQAYPNDAISKPDPITGLVPVALAAMAFVQEKEKQQQQDDDDDYAAYQLDTIYALLKLYPQVLSEVL